MLFFFNSRSCKELELALTVSQKLLLAIQHATGTAEVAKYEEKQLQMGAINLPDVSKLPPSGNPANKSHGNSDYNNLQTNKDEPHCNRQQRRNLAKASKKFPSKYKYVRASPSRTPDSLPDPFRTSVRTESREGHDFVKSGNMRNPFCSEPSKDNDDSTLPDDSETNSPSIPLNIRSKPRSFTPEKNRLLLNPFHNETLAQGRSQLPDVRGHISPEFLNLNSILRNHGVRED